MYLWVWFTTEEEEEEAIFTEWRVCAQSPHRSMITQLFSKFPIHSFFSHFTNYLCTLKGLMRGVHLVSEG